MRPGSRGGLGSSGGGGAPPSTGMSRPMSGRRPPATGQRLFTGQTTSAAGTQAAGGVALQASINVADRPMTGQGVMGMRVQGATGRLVEDTSYYVGLVRKKMTDVNQETTRLRQEIDQQSKDSSQIAQLEKKYETLLKNKEALEGQLADYNLALDKVSSKLCPQSLSHICSHVLTLLSSLHVCFCALKHARDYRQELPLM